MGYRNITIDLAMITPGTTQELVGAGNAITSFYVSRWPGGDGVLRLGGTGQDDIPVDETLTWNYDPCDGPVTTGLYFRIPAIALAGTFVVVVFFGGGAAAAGA